jgi:hypothetical protein
MYYIYIIWENFLKMTKFCHRGFSGGSTGKSPAITELYLQQELLLKKPSYASRSDTSAGLLAADLQEFRREIRPWF